MRDEDWLERFEPIDPPATSAIRAALVGVASASERLTNASLDSVPSKGSRAHDLFFGESSRRRITMDGFLIMHMAIVSGSDHARAFAALLSRSSPNPLAASTVARGALESLARSWFVQDHREWEDFARRSLSVLYADLRYPASFGESVWSRGGVEIDAGAQRREHAEELERLGLGGPMKYSQSEAVAALLDRQRSDGSARSRYSLLSSIAHAHRLGTNGFLRTDPTGAIVGVRAPRDVMLEFAFDIVLGFDQVMGDFIDLLGAPQQIRERWDAALHRAYRVFADVPKGVHDD